MKHHETKETVLLKENMSSVNKTNAGEGVVKMGPSCTVGGNVKWYNQHGKQNGGTSGK